MKKYVVIVIALLFLSLGVGYFVIDRQAIDIDLSTATAMEQAIIKISTYDLATNAIEAIRISAKTHLSQEELSNAPDFIKKPQLTQSDKVKISNYYLTPRSLFTDPWIAQFTGPYHEIRKANEEKQRRKDIIVGAGLLVAFGCAVAIVVYGARQLWAKRSIREWIKAYRLALRRGLLLVAAWWIVLAGYAAIEDFHIDFGWFLKVAIIPPVAAIVIYLLFKKFWAEPRSN